MLVELCIRNVQEGFRIVRQRPEISGTFQKADGHREEEVAVFGERKLAMGESRKHISKTEGKRV